MPLSDTIYLHFPVTVPLPLDPERPVIQKQPGDRLACQMMTWHDLCAVHFSVILASASGKRYYDVKCNTGEVFNIQIEVASGKNAEVAAQIPRPETRSQSRLYTQPAWVWVTVT